MTRNLAGLLLLAAVLVSGGCGTFGPGNLGRDRFDYAEAISDSWKRMMLLNIVKIRYGDSPVFLEVSSVINQYSVEAELSAGLSWSTGLNNDGQSVGGAGRYRDSPTISYSPLMGADFTKNLMRPIPPASLLALIQSGYRADFLFSVCVSAINGIYNRSAARLIQRDADPEFQTLLEATTRIQQAGKIGMRLDHEGKSGETVLFFHREMTPEVSKDRDEIKRLLGLDPETTEYSLFYGAVNRDGKTLAILTRSMLAIMAEFSALVEVPEIHIQENRASPGIFDDADSIEEQRIRVRIHSSADEPEDAFASVQYRDHWFYIEDMDFRSKRMFTFMLFLFNMVESGTSATAPILTLPAGE